MLAKVSHIAQKGKKECTLECGKNVPSGINIPPGPFGKMNKCTPWKIEDFGLKIINICIIWALFQQQFVNFLKLINIPCEIRAISAGKMPRN